MCNCIDSCRIYTARLSPALNGSSEIWRFECSEIRNGIIFYFHTGLPHIGRDTLQTHPNSSCLADSRLMRMESRSQRILLHSLWKSKASYLQQRAARAKLFKAPSDSISGLHTVPHLDCMIVLSCLYDNYYPQAPLLNREKESLIIVKSDCIGVLLVCMHGFQFLLSFTNSGNLHHVNSYHSLITNCISGYFLAIILTCLIIHTNSDVSNPLTPRDSLPGDGHSTGRSLPGSSLGPSGRSIREGGGGRARNTSC